MKMPIYPNAMKRCAQCREVKSLDAFSIFRRSTDGRRWQCRACRKRVYEENREANLAKQALWRASRTPEQRAAKARKDAVYYQANKEKRDAYNKKKREENPEASRLYFVNYYWIHREKNRIRSAAWRKANPEKRKANDARRRATKANAPRNDLTRGQWKEILQAFSYRCVYCPPQCIKCQRKQHKLTQDHVTPYEHNGSHTLWNIVPACGSCNSRKRDKPILQPVHPLLLTVAAAKAVKKRPKKM